MNSQVVQQPQSRGLTGPEWLVSMEYGGPPPPANGGAAHATAIRERATVRIETRETEPGTRIDEMADRSDATYRLGSPIGRVIQACLALPFALVFGFISLWLLRGGLAGLLLMVSFPGPVAFALFAAVWHSLSRPYEVHIGASSALRFVSVMDTTEFSAADIVRIVRRQRRSNGSLDTLRLEYLGGSVTMNGHEEICARLRALHPMVQMGTEEWDDTD